MSQPAPDLNASPVQPIAPSGTDGAQLFAARTPERTGSPVMAWAIAGVAVMLAVVGIVLATQRKAAPSPNALQPLDPYAPSLAFSNIQMSESSSLSAVKVTYIDGRIRNAGARTVTHASVQVLFANDMQLPPQVETVPLTLIRTHEPYIDTQPVSAAPLRPGDDREFRLIFENIGSNWNQQLPQMRVIHVD